MVGRLFWVSLECVASDRFIGLHVISTFNYISTFNCKPLSFYHFLWWNTWKQQYFLLLINIWYSKRFWLKLTEISHWLIWAFTFIAEETHNSLLCFVCVNVCQLFLFFPVFNFNLLTAKGKLNICGTKCNVLTYASIVKWSS